MVCQHTALMCFLFLFFFLTIFVGKGKYKKIITIKYKIALQGWKKRLPGRLTQLPFIAPDKRLNHTLHWLKCLPVIRSRIFLYVLPLAGCS